MKLYYSPGACSLSPHIAAHEAGLPVTLVKVNLKTKRTEDGGDFLAVNPRGYVPVLELDDGTRLTEGPAIVQYIADHVPGENLAPANGTIARYQLQEWLNFLTSEIHKQFGPLFYPTTSDEVKQQQRDKIATRLDWTEQQLAGQDYVMGTSFTVADAYLFTLLNWAKPVGIDLARWPGLQSYMATVAARPAVQAALKAEGLVR